MSTVSLTLLGSTGSIGVSTLDVVARYPERFRLFALAGHRQVEKLAEQCLAFKPQYAVVADETAAQALKTRLSATKVRTEVLFGEQALCDVAASSAVDAVMAAIVGAAGLTPTLAAAQAGKTIYLANKETLVMAGSVFMQTAREHGARILPVDSEHNAIYQVLPEKFDGNLANVGIESLILTASGGPFLHTPLRDFARITPAQAVKHPNWSMGQKISVDSATMMNKGLELIEAHWLFQALPQQLEVLIHPQSIVHSMVRYSDGSVLSQMGVPDMRTPIAYCLGLPERLDAGVEKLDLARVGALTFSRPDFVRFPCLHLAYEALQAGHAAPCVLNAANEVAVTAFLAKRIGYPDIAALVAYCLHNHGHQKADSLEALLSLDGQVRSAAQVWVRNHFRVLSD